MKYGILLLLMMHALFSCQSHSNCPAYASVRKKESRFLNKAKKKARKKKKQDSGLFTKEQLQVIRSGKKAARQSRRNLKKKQ